MKTRFIFAAFLMLTLLSSGSVALQHPLNAADETPAATQSANAILPYLGILLREDYPDPRSTTFTHFGSDNWELNLAEDGTPIACDAATDFSGLGFGDANSKNYSIEFRGKIVATDETVINDPSLVTISWRSQKNGGYADGYHISVDLRDSNINTYVTDPPKHFFAIGWKPLGSLSVQLGLNTWFTLRSEMIDTHLRAYFNGRLAADQRDTIYANGGGAIIVTPGTTLCVGYVIVRSLDTSYEAWAAAERGLVTKSTSVMNTLDKTATILAHLQKGDEVFILDTSPDKKQTLIRIDKTGIQGWVPSDAFGSVLPPTPTKAP